MTDYKCGHSQDLLILDDNPLSIAAYLEWSESVGRDGTREQCFSCWTNKLNANLPTSLNRKSDIPIPEENKKLKVGKVPPGVLKEAQSNRNKEMQK